MAEDQDVDQGLLFALGDDAWLIIPFALGFIAFGSPWSKIFEQMIHRALFAIGLSKEIGLPSSMSARLTSPLSSQAKEDSSPNARTPTGERLTVDVEYLSVHSELSAIRSEILRERGSTSLA
jgi:hypothetical protein